MRSCTLFFPHWGNSRWWKRSEGESHPLCVDPAKTSLDYNNAPLGAKVYCFSPFYLGTNAEPSPSNRINIAAFGKRSTDIASLVPPSSTAQNRIDGCCHLSSHLRPVCSSYSKFVSWWEAYLTWLWIYSSQFSLVGFVCQSVTIWNQDTSTIKS